MVPLGALPARALSEHDSGDKANHMVPGCSIWRPPTSCRVRPPPITPASPSSPATTTNSYLEDRQTPTLDRLAAEEGISRVELIRRILDRALLGHDGDWAADLARLGVAFGGGHGGRVATLCAAV